MANSIFDNVWNTVSNLKKKAQTGIQNWAQANPQQATRIINAPAKIAQTYQKVAPYVPMAPRITTPQQIQTNYQSFNRNIVQPVKQQVGGLWQGMTESPTTYDINRGILGKQSNFGYQVGKTISGGGFSPLQTFGKVPSLVKTGINLAREWGPYGELQKQTAENTERRIQQDPKLRNNKMLADSERIMSNFLTMGIISAHPQTPNFKKVDIRKVFNPQDEEIMRNFAIAVEEVGPKKALGELGKNAQYVVKRYFGNKFTNLSNQKIKQLFDYTLTKIDDARGQASNPLVIKPRGVELPVGLKTQEVEGLTQQALKNKPPVQGGVGGVPPTANAPYKPKGNLLTSLTDRWVRSSRSVLQKMGKTGGELASKVDDMYNTSERMVGTATNHYKQLTNSLDDAGVQRVSSSLNGEKVALNPQEQQAAKGLRTILDSIWTKAKEMGLNPGRKENYFPNIPDVKKLQVNKQAVADYFVKTKQIPTIEKAISFIDDIINGADMDTAYVRLFGKARPKVSGFLEKNRLFEWPTQVIRTDRGVIPEYFQQTLSRISQVQNFGKNNEIGEKMLLDLTKQGYSVDAAKEILEQNLGLTKYNPQLSKGLGIVRAVQSLMKMPLGAITNASQSVNTATVYGTRRTLKSIFNQATGGGSAQEQYALRTGAITDAVMQDIMETWKGKGALAKFAAPGFGTVEKLNRIISSNVGADYANKLVNQLKSNPNNKNAINELTKLIGKFDVDSLIKSGISEEQLLKAGQTATNITQFKTRPIDMPIEWNSPMGKTLSQFKNFAFKQAGFIKNQVLAPATKGNFGPLARYILLGIIAGEGVNQAKDFVKGTIGAGYQVAKTGLTEGRLPTGTELGTAYEKGKGRVRPTDPGQRALQNFTSVGSFGLITDAFNAMSAASKFGSRSILEFIVGPTGSDLAKVATDVSELGQGKPRNLVRNSIRSIPFVGQSIANIEYPKAANDSAKMDIPAQLQKIKTGFELEPYKLQQQNQEVERGNATLKIFNEIKDLPIEEAKAVLFKYKKDGTLTKSMYTGSLLPKIKEYKQGVSPSEKSVKGLGVDVEAKYYYDKTRDMSTEEKKKYLGDLKKRGVLTKPTYLQFLKLEKETL
jgi:hypothetical protein